MEVQCLQYIVQRPWEEVDLDWDVLIFTKEFHSFIFRRVRV